MKLTHLLLAALVALPLGLAGCDASGPDAANALQVAPTTTQADASAPGKSGGPIFGPETITVGNVETYSRYGATDMRVKGLGGSAIEVNEYSVNDPEGIPTRYLDVQGTGAGAIRIEAYHPNFGWAYLPVDVVNAPTACTAVGALNGPTTLALNQTATYSATCANLLDIVDETGAGIVLSQSVSYDSQGRPTVTGTIKATSSGTFRARAFNGSLVRAKRVTVPAQATCDLSSSAVNGIFGPNSIRSGGLGTYSAYGAIDMDRKNLSAQLTVEDEYTNGKIPPTRYLEVRASGEGNAQIKVTFPNSSASRTITVCPSKVATRL